MSGCRSLTSALYCWRIRSWSGRLRRRGFRARAVRSAAAAAAPGDRARSPPGFSVALSPRSSIGSSNSEALPGAPLGMRLRAAAGGVAQRPGRPLPDPIGGELPLEVGIAVRLEKVPFQIVFAHMVHAEPVEFVEVVRRLGARNLPGRVHPERSQIRLEVSTPPDMERPRARRFLSADTETSKSKIGRQLIWRGILDCSVTRGPRV